MTITQQHQDQPPHTTGDRKVGADVRLVSVQEVEQAHQRIKPHIHRTPLQTSTALDALATEAVLAHLGGEGMSSSSSSSSSSPLHVRLAFKSEHLQRVGAFKMRGATNAVLSHIEQLRHTAPAFDTSSLWIVTHSSGNHAAAVACAARSVGARAAVVMPHTAPGVKKAAVRGYGARVVECEPTQAAREATAKQLMDELRNGDGEQNTVVRFIHPYDEEWVIAGQGTLALEMLEQASELQASIWSATKRNEQDEPLLDLVVTPVGGGGQLSGVATAVKGKDERIVVIAAEPEYADDAARTFSTGILQPAISPPKTICDGLLTALSPLTYAHVCARVTDVLTASERQIVGATRLVWERMKQVIEPSAAVGLAVALHSPAFAEHVRSAAVQKRAQLALANDMPVEIRVGIVWTGGNVEMATIAKAFAQYDEEDKKAVSKTSGFMNAFDAPV